MSEENPQVPTIVKTTYKDLLTKKYTLDIELMNISYEIWRNHSLCAIIRFKKNYEILISWEDGETICKCRSCIWVRDDMKKLTPPHPKN